MNKSEAEKVIRNTIEYANREIEKSKKTARKRIVGLIIAFSVLLISGIVIVRLASPAESRKEPAEILREYSQNPDGTWECEGRTYKYKLEISGRMHGTAVDSVFVYLSNALDITFEQAWKAAGFSSNTNDYFDVDEAVLVEWRTEKQISE